MRGTTFQNVLASVPMMTEAQLDELVLAVDGRRSRTKALRVLETAWGAPQCAHCASELVFKNGHSRGLQRYRCHACRRTFNVTTGTPWRDCNPKNGFSSKAIAWRKA